MGGLVSNKGGSPLCILAPPAVLILKIDLLLQQFIPESKSGVNPCFSRAIFRTKTAWASSSVHTPVLTGIAALPSYFKEKRRIFWLEGHLWCRRFHMRFRPSGTVQELFTKLHYVQAEMYCFLFQNTRLKVAYKIDCQGSQREELLHTTHNWYMEFAATGCGDGHELLRWL